MKNRGAGRALSLFLVSQLLLAGPVFAAPISRVIGQTIRETVGTSIGRTEQEKRSSEKELKEVRREIEDLEQQKETVLSEITEIDEKISELLITIQVLEDEIKEKKTEIQAAETEYLEALKQEQNQYDAMKKRIRYVYEKGDTTYLEIMLKAKSLSDVICESEYFVQLYEYDRRMFLDYKEVKEQVEALEQRYRAEEAEMEVMESEYLEQKETLERSVASKRQEAADFDEKLVSAKQKAEIYAKAVKEQTEKLRQLREVKRRQMAEQVSEGNEAAGGSGGGNNLSGNSLSGNSLSGNNPPGNSTPGNNPSGNYPSGGSASGNTGVNSGIKSVGGSARGREIADYALQFVGNPYVWGGTSLTNGADCSGFVQSVYKHFGVSIPRTSAEQSKFGKRVPFEDLQPGDLVFYAGHVVMSIGEGRIVHASSAKEGIKVSDDVTYRTILDIRRPWEP